MRKMNNVLAALTFFGLIFVAVTARSEEVGVSASMPYEFVRQTPEELAARLDHEFQRVGEVMSGIDVQSVADNVNACTALMKSVQAEDQDDSPVFDQGFKACMEQIDAATQWARDVKITVLQLRVLQIDYQLSGVEVPEALTYGTFSFATQAREALGNLRKALLPLRDFVNLQ